MNDTDFDIDPELNVDSRDLRKVVEKMVDGIIADPVRAAQLGIVPQGNNTISKRGEFIVNESNIEEAENKKMRGYRHREYGASGKALYSLHPKTGAPIDLIVYNPAEETAAIAKGWSAVPVHGPSGRLNGEPVLDTPAITTVRDFAAPGETQPFEQPVDKPARRKPGPKPKKDQVN